MTDRLDLGAMFAQITRRLIDEERPILEAHHLAMWEYIALSRLQRRSASTQLELAQAIGYDKTRLIALLDELEQRGLLSRTPDPSDRRARIVRLTEAGARTVAGAKRDIRAMEERVLSSLSESQRATLLEVLPGLAHPGE